MRRHGSFLESGDDRDSTKCGTRQVSIAFGISPRQGLVNRKAERDSAPPISSLNAQTRCGPGYISGEQLPSAAVSSYDPAPATRTLHVHNNWSAPHGLQSNRQREHRRSDHRRDELVTVLPRSAYGVADVLLMDPPLHVFARDIEPSRDWIWAGPRNVCVHRGSIYRRQALVNRLRGEPQQLLDKTGRQSPRRNDPFRVDPVDERDKIFIWGGLQVSDVITADRDVPEVASDDVQRDIAHVPAATDSRFGPLARLQLSEQLDESLAVRNQEVADLNQIRFPGLVHALILQDAADHQMMGGLRAAHLTSQSRVKDRGDGGIAHVGNMYSPPVKQVALAV